MRTDYRGKVKPKDYIYLVIIIIAMIVYFLRYHQLLDVFFGTLVFSSLILILWSEYIESHRKKSFLNATAGSLLILSAFFYQLRIYVDNFDNTVGTLLITLVGIGVSFFLFSRAYKIGEYRK